MSQPSSPAPPDERAGIVLAASAYVLWGILPLFWHLLDGIPPFQITAYRILFCALLMALIAVGRGRISRLVSVIRSPSVLRNLAVSAALIAGNWTLYVYSVSSAQIVEASLGYYILPLISIGLGVTLLGEKLSRVRLAALALAAAAVAAQAIAFGHLPLIALGLAFTFGFYGFVRKSTAVDPLDGLLIETGLLFLPALAALGWWSAEGIAAFNLAVPGRDGLLALSGVFTAIPLVLFAAGARRIRLSTLGFLQYLAPTLMLLVATLVYGEPFSLVDAVTFVCLWAALLVIALEGRIGRARLKAQK